VLLTTEDEDDSVDEDGKVDVEDVTTKVSIRIQGLGQQNLLEDITTNVGGVGVVLDDETLDDETVDDETLDDETTGATWYRFKTDLPPQYSFGLSAQTILQGLGFAIVLVLTDPALMTLPQ
jgi:hypothetical protein